MGSGEVFEGNGAKTAPTPFPWFPQTGWLSGCASSRTRTRSTCCGGARSCFPPSRSTCFGDIKPGHDGAGVCREDRLAHQVGRVRAVLLRDHRGERTELGAPARPCGEPRDEGRRPGGAGLWRRLRRILRRPDPDGGAGRSRTPRCSGCYGAVLEAQKAAIAAVRPGVRAGDIDAAARRALGRHKLAEAFGHSTGHGLGVEIHETPRIGPRREADRQTRRRPRMTRSSLDGLHHRAGRVSPGLGWRPDRG